MKYIITFCALSACGLWATNTAISAEDVPDIAAETKNSSEEKFGDKISAISRNTRSYREPLTNEPNPNNPASDTQALSPIPAIILPNNICVINSDISPDRTIEEHIMACVTAHRLRQRTTR